jgi:hypothetical protein
MALHPDEMDAAIIRNLRQKTGRTLEQWIALLQAAPAFAKPKDAIVWLKGTHAVGHIAAQLIVKRAAGERRDGAAELIAALFSDAERRALYEALASHLVRAFPGTRVTPCKGYVGFGDPTQYAVVKPHRAGGVLVGLARTDPALSDLEPASGLGGSARIRWKVVVASEREIPQVVQHLSTAR